MLDTAQDLNQCEKEVGVRVEQLFTPCTRYDAQRPEDFFAIDNGAYSGFEAGAFLRCLEKHKDRRKLCRFVAVPDVVSSERRTLEAFDYWYPRLIGWKKALVAQDGIENLTIPWDLIDAIFIGGSTGWKMGRHAADVIHTAKICGKWIHVGRVNTGGRFEYFEQLGADSIDGSGLSKFAWVREAIYRHVHQGHLFSEGINEPTT